MLPKWHIFYGAIFSIILFLILKISPLEAILLFSASVLIDVDHYIWYIINKKDWSLKRSYEWYMSNPRLKKPYLHIFHTIEFMIFLVVLSFFWYGFIYLLLGIVFHSILDLIEMGYKNTLHHREYSLINYLKSNR